MSARSPPPRAEAAARRWGPRPTLSPPLAVPTAPALRPPRSLGHAEPVAAVVAQRRLDAVEALAWLGQEVHSLSAQLGVRALAIVGPQYAGAQHALRDEPLHLLGRFLVHHRGAGLEQDQLVVRLARRGDGQPAEVVHSRVGVHLEAELVGVEGERLVLVEHPDGRVREPGDHEVVLLRSLAGAS
jgi:hypothetical protein